MSGNRIEIFFFFSSLSPLSSLSLLILPSPFLSPRLSLPPGMPRPPWRAPLGGGGGVERSLEGTPRPARGDGGMWRVGRGREPWERSEAGGVNDNERHLRHSPVSSPTEELRKDKRRSDDSGRRERTRPGLLVCVLCAAVVREGLPLYFYVCLFLLNLCWMFAGSRLLLPDLRTLLQLYKIRLGILWHQLLLYLFINTMLMLFVYFT